MKRLIEFPLEDGSFILVEVNEPDPGDVGLRAAWPSDVITRANQTLEEALEKIRPAAGAVISKLRYLHDRPDSIDVTFGITLSAEAGAVLASAGVEANYAVTLRWNNKPEGIKTAKKSG